MMKHLLTMMMSLSLAFSFCQNGKLNVMGRINKDIKEVSAIETISSSPLLWVIEDAGNKTEIFGLDRQGNIKRIVNVVNAKNNDWEDLTSDSLGNLYIGDFGNNSKKRREFSILKVSNVNIAKEFTQASIINFTLPKGIKSKDFEAFFLFEDYFYIFSKERKKAVVLKVPNEIGFHKAKLVSKYYLKGKRTRVTSADISKDGKTIILLNHDCIWKLTNFEGDGFFKGTVTKIELGHDSQKEGVCFENDETLYITDERVKSRGGNIYKFEL